MALGQTGPISLNGPKQAICRPITTTQLISKDGPSQCETSNKEPGATKAFIKPHRTVTISKMVQGRPFAVPSLPLSSSPRMDHLNMSLQTRSLGPPRPSSLHMELDQFPKMVQSRPFAVPSLPLKSSLPLRLIFGYGTTCCVLGPPVALGQTGSISLNGPKQAICRPISTTQLISKDGPSEYEPSDKVNF